MAGRLSGRLLDREMMVHNRGDLLESKKQHVVEDLGAVNLPSCLARAVLIVIFV